jgi:hypothetical protein
MCRKSRKGIKMGGSNQVSTKTEVIAFIDHIYEKRSFDDSSLRYLKNTLDRYFNEMQEKLEQKPRKRKKR